MKHSISRAGKLITAVFITGLLAAMPLGVMAADDGESPEASPEAWAEKPGFQRGEGGPADTGEAGEKCQDISDENRKKECVRKARIKTETALKKKEIEEEASSEAEAEQKKAALEKQAKEKKKEVEKAAEEAEKKEKEAATAQ